MSISGPGPVQGGLPIRPNPPVTPAAKPAATSALAPTDEVQISSAGRLLDELQQDGNVRAERLAQIRAAIEAGEYETPEKLEAALSRLFTEIRAESKGS
ncbi:MAG: flagellar biosynthesis anti-sigma factor FlgM [Planctomycetaceae bacterium]